MHQLRIRTATRHQQSAHVQRRALLAEINETEPNNDFAAPQKITLDTTVNGVVDNEDVDYFVVEAKKGERITAEIEGLRLGNTFFDPYVAILDTKRFELARSDDAPLVRQDCVCSIIAPEDGKYIIQVRETLVRRQRRRALYRLHVGRFPRPTAVLPAGGKPGEDARRAVARRRGRRPRPRRSRCPARWRSEFGLFAQDDQRHRPLGQSVPPERSGQRARSRTEQRPGRRPRRATAPMRHERRHRQAGRRRLLQVRRQEGAGVRRPRAGPRLRLAARSGAERLPHRRRARRRQRRQRRPGQLPAVHRCPRTTRTSFTSAITSSKGGADYVYRVEVTPVKPRLTLGLPERQPVCRRHGRRCRRAIAWRSWSTPRGPISAAT